MIAFSCSGKGSTNHKETLERVCQRRPGAVSSTKSRTPKPRRV
jgi:hypothetical protein